jgi:hypothetical protein
MALFRRICRPAFAEDKSIEAELVCLAFRPVSLEACDLCISVVNSRIQRSQVRSCCESMRSKVVVPTTNDRVSPNPAISACIMPEFPRLNAIQGCSSNARKYCKPSSIAVVQPRQSRKHLFLHNSHVRSFCKRICFLRQEHPITCQAHQRRNVSVNQAAG